MVVASLSTPARDQQPPQCGSTSPAAPYQTVHAVFQHTAFRHRSLQCMRRPVVHRAPQSVDPEGHEPPVVEAGAPVAPVEPVLLAGKDGHPFVHVAVDDVELPR